MKTICFFTYEFYPYTSGGCGTYIRQAVDFLSEDFNIIILIHNSKEVLDSIDHLYKNTKNIKVFRVQDLLYKTKTFINIYKLRSWEFYIALKQICSDHKVDIVEMFEYVGIGYFTLKNRKQLKNNPKLIVRAHGPMKIIDYYENDFKFDLNRKYMYAMEKYTLVNSDIRLFSLQEIMYDFNKHYKYKFTNLKNYFLPPNIETIKLSKVIQNAPKNYLFFSNLKKIKNPEGYIEIALNYLEKNPLFSGKFYIAGSDSLYNKKTTYWDYLKSLIPENKLIYFKFLGKLDHYKLIGILPSIKCVIFCSKWESFSLTFYEIIKTGVPIIAPNISCFNFLLNKYPCFYNNTKKAVELIFSHYSFKINFNNLTKLLRNSKNDYVSTYKKI